MDVYLNENSLDVLLFVIGILNLSGPYSLRSSIIQANCCKVLKLVHQCVLTIIKKQKDLFDGPSLIFHFCLISFCLIFSLSISCLP